MRGEVLTTSHCCRRLKPGLSSGFFLASLRFGSSRKPCGDKSVQNIGVVRMRIIVPGSDANPKRTDRFRQFAQTVSAVAGSPIAFAAGISLVGLWAISGPYFGYSEEWQLVINTSTTIVTFLMVFVIQNTQARDSKELHLKLDELLRAVETARNTIINCADLSDEELQEVEADLRSNATHDPVRSSESASIVTQ